MLKWIGDALASTASWLGQGVASLLNWLLSGLISLATKVLDAAGGIFDLLDSLFGFFTSVKDALVGLLQVVFPWVPPEVMTVITYGLFAVLLAGIVKQVRGK